MSTNRALMCLTFVVLAGCSGAAPAAPGVTSPLAARDLCPLAEELMGVEIAVAGPFETGVVTPNGGSAAECEPGSCCNVTYYAPSIACSNGQRIDVYVEPSLYLREGVTPSAFAPICRAQSYDLRPSDACPVPSSCAERFGALPPLVGHLEMREPIFGGEPRLTFVVTEVSLVGL